MPSQVGQPLTQGAHHIGLAVSRLEETAGFFTRLLGWSEIRRDENYPAIFVSDGTVMVSLWQLDQPSQAFDRRRNAGLHHVAFRVATRATLAQIHQIIAQAALKIEFGPELLRQGPAMHMMCYEPSGIRVEFIWPGI